MKTQRFRQGQTVYIQDRYRAKVVKTFPDGSVTVDVFEGLGASDRAPWRGTYAPELVKKKKRKPKER